MEKNDQQPAGRRRILITGAESTGKSELAVDLAQRYGGKVIPEYAREYMVRLNRPYLYRDVEHIARHQVAAYGNALNQEGWVFFDTWLIITKVWFEEVFGKVPGWVEEHLREARFDLVLLCDTDIPWIPDPVRENGGARREALMQRYRDELDRYGFPYVPVSGSGAERTRCALNQLKKHLNHGTD